MKDPDFQRAQWDLRFSEHIAPVNQFVDVLAKEARWLPYVAPLYGGIHAEMLNVLRDPGPKTQLKNGSGFICLENDDPTAENMCSFLYNAGIDPARTLAWNAYPWYINRHPTARELNEGAIVFCQLLKLLPKLRVLMLNGRSAQDMWKRARRQGVNLLGNVMVLETFHTSARALRNPRQKKHVEDTFKQAANLLAPVRSPNPSTVDGFSAR
jgi:hypothetical protein